MAAAAPRSGEVPAPAAVAAVRGPQASLAGRGHGSAGAGDVTVFATAGRAPTRFPMIRPRMTVKHLRIATVVGALAVAGAVGACGEAKVEDDPANSDLVNRGAQLFHDRCSGCHTLSAAAAEGSNTQIHDLERTDGPNFNQRHETVDQVLFAIRNGGFSGAIMPQNIVVGEDAQAVAEFVAKYSGSEDGSGSQDSQDDPSLSQ